MGIAGGIAGGIANEEMGFPFVTSSSILLVSGSCVLIEAWPVVLCLKNALPSILAFRLPPWWLMSHRLAALKKFGRGEVWGGGVPNFFSSNTDQFQ